MTRREFRDLSAPSAARAAIENLSLSPGPEAVQLSDAVGRVLAERIDAPIDVPGFDRSAMDGYALQAAETVGASEPDPVRLAVVGAVHAGEEPTVEPGEGQAVRIATGAVMPETADAVVPVEQTLERDNQDAVAVTTAVPPGASVMPRGADIASGDRALESGTRLAPRHVGLLAALGRERVDVRGEPVVGIVATGDELVQPGGTLDPASGQIYDVNSPALTAAVETTGASARVYTPASDDIDDLRGSVETAAGDCDLLLTSGSTSAGEADHLYTLVEEHGSEAIHGVAIKPGRPMLVGTLFGTPYVGLSGYPVSAMMVFRTFVAPRLRAVAGLPEPATGTCAATLRTRVRYEGGRLRLLPVGLVGDGDGGFVAYAPAKGSGATTTLAETDGLVRIAPETTQLSRGASVTVERFDADDPVPELLCVGEPDPVFGRLLDNLQTPRYLSLGKQDARRWMRDGIPDVRVAAGEVSPVTAEADELAAWEREWGLVVPSGNPEEIEGVDDLVERDLKFGTLDDSLAVRGALEAELAAAGVTDPETEITGFGLGLPGLESAARAVATGRIDVGVGLRATAEALGLACVSLGSQRVRLLPRDDRQEKSGMSELTGVISSELQPIVTEQAGYSIVGNGD